MYVELQPQQVIKRDDVAYFLPPSFHIIPTPCFIKGAVKLCQKVAANTFLYVEKKALQFFQQHAGRVCSRPLLGI